MYSCNIPEKEAVNVHNIYCSAISSLKGIIDFFQHFIVCVFSLLVIFKKKKKRRLEKSSTPISFLLI